MEKIQLQSALREANTRNAKQEYRKGAIPAELYGHKINNVHLSVNQIDFEKVLRKAGESTIIELLLPSGEKRNVLIQEVDRHYLTSKPIHVDFYEVSMTEKLTATVQIEFIGEADAVKVLGGTLVKVINEVEVECLPTAIPKSIQVDISSLKIGDSIHVKDIVFPAGVKPLNDPEASVVAVIAPMKEEVPAEVVEGATQEPEVIKEKKEVPAEEGEGAGKDKEKK